MTRTLIVSDVHANLAALEAAIRDAESGGPIDAVWSLGDCVGYGPQPAECIARLRGHAASMVAGNHERAATGAIGTEDFNPDAAAAAEWTKARLSTEDKEFLDAMPEVEHRDSFTLVHGTLRWPIWEYLYSPEDLTDETFNRVARKLAAGVELRPGAPRMDTGGGGER